MIAHVLGKLLKKVHADEGKLIWNHPSVCKVPASIQLWSPAFAENASIPLRYAGKGAGDNLSPPLCWSNIPDTAAELVLIMEDPDVPLPQPIVHLIAAGISPASSSLDEGAIERYRGPRALPGHGAHRYIFEIFALRALLSFSGTLTRKILLDVWQGSVVARGRTIGLFEQR